MMMLAAALSSKYSEALNRIWQRTDADATSVSEQDWALENELAYQVIRLLRHLSGDAMGPATSVEFYKDRAGWVRRWAEWGRKG